MKIISIIKYVFFVIGIALLVGAFFSYSNTQEFLNTAIVTDGTVTELVRSRSNDSTTYSPVIEFMTESGQLVEFLSTTGSNPPSYSVGEIVEVLYEDASPEQAKINSFSSLWGGEIISVVLGAAFFLIGFVMILMGSLKGRKVKYLEENGVPVLANFQSVEINGSINVNGRSPYQIFAQWKDPMTSELYIFKSENIWFNPIDHINQDEITVLIEKDNPKKYYVDTSFLPKIAS